MEVLPFCPAGSPAKIADLKVNSLLARRESGRIFYVFGVPLEQPTLQTRAGRSREGPGLCGPAAVLFPEPTIPAARVLAHLCSQGGHCFLVLFWGRSSKRLNENNSFWASSCLKKQSWKELVI